MGGISLGGMHSLFASVASEGFDVAFPLIGMPKRSLHHSQKSPKILQKRPTDTLAALGVQDFARAVADATYQVLGLGFRA